MDSQDRRSLIVGPAEHTLQFRAFDIGGEARRFGFNLAGQFGLLAAGQLRELDKVLGALEQVFPLLNESLLKGKLLFDLLGRLGVVPERRLESQLRQFVEASLASFDVKGSLRALERAPSVSGCRPLARG